MTCKCQIPPEGWTCSREPGHDGPCAADPEVDRIDFYYQNPDGKYVPFLRPPYSETYPGDCRVKFRDGFLLFCENSVWEFFPEKPKPWYTRVLNWFKRRVKCLVG
jgi:hypothetical protein